MNGCRPSLVSAAADRVAMAVIREARQLNLWIPGDLSIICLLYTSPSPRDISGSRMPSSA